MRVHEGSSLEVVNQTSDVASPSELCFSEGAILVKQTLKHE
jgi:hypothetical protein